jgi:hypothetical protein
LAGRHYPRGNGDRPLDSVARRVEAQMIARSRLVAVERLAPGNSSSDLKFLVRLYGCGPDRFISRSARNTLP